MFRPLWLVIGFVIVLFAVGFVTKAHSETREVGDVGYKFNLVGPNDKIVVVAVEDPKVEGVTCFWSTARTGGISGAMGLATDPNEASLACRQIGPIRFKDKFSKVENIAKESRNWTSFRTMQVVRMCDDKTNTLVYLVYTDEIVHGFPKNSLSVVPLGLDKDSSFCKANLK